MSKIKKLYFQLKKRYNLPEKQWKMWCRRPKTIKEREEVVIGAILTQNTNWQNVEKAIANLKKADLLNLDKIAKINLPKLKKLIKPCGFFNVKSKYLKDMAGFVLDSGGIKELKKNNWLKLRENLLNQKGVGQETADSILNYALDKPSFVIDAYTRRFVKKYNLTQEQDYEKLKNLFQDSLKKDFRLYQDYHALIVIDGQNS